MVKLVQQERITVLHPTGPERKQDMNTAGSNFDFLQAEPRFKHFADIARVAEQVLRLDYAASIINCRRALECAIRWQYSVDKALKQPWDDRLASLTSTTEFRGLVGDILYQKILYIRKKGNQAAHTHTSFKEEEAQLCLANLHVYFSYLSRCYSKLCKWKRFDAALIPDLLSAPPAPVAEEKEDPRLEQLLKENAALQEQLTAQRQQQKSETATEQEPCEYETRKLYIDAMLQDAGWVENHDWRNEVELPGMPNKAGVGYADYVLYSDSGKALAVVEAKRTSVGVEKGRQQAQLYADLLEKQQGSRPVVFLSNGFDTYLVDNEHPERRVAGIYSKRDLEKLLNIRRMRTSLAHVAVDKQIAGRYYQEAAIKAVCESFDRDKQRRALLVMATGSGKTRTVIALCKVLLEHGWARDILFLADRTALVTQAKRAFSNMLPDLSLTNLCEDKTNVQARCVFSTYNTMMNCIDTVEDDKGKVFTCGHFDLLICDEAHRSIYNKYKAIFQYFDAPLVGLTATPKDEIDHNTYEIFNLEDGVPTYGYDLRQAVTDGHLVDFVPVETVLKFMQDGISYDELSDKEKESYEETFTDDDGELPESIESTALNSWVFNEDTIRQVLDILMQKGLRVDYGNRIGKTIIFARNHAHAEKILEVFGKEYPHLTGQAQVIDNYINYAQAAIDRFTTPDQLPTIAITVDMLDTGIDVPSILNLVFFKKVRSKAKFWQMIGRGTRLCPGLLDGEDKKEFYIFDFCSNFEFFRMSDGQGREVPSVLPIQGALFALKASIVSKLQGLTYQTEFLTGFRQRLVDELVAKVQELNRDNFAVRQCLREVVRFSTPEAFRVLTADDLEEDIRPKLAPLVQPEPDEPGALRFDALMYGVEHAYLAGDGKGLKRRTNEIKKKVLGLSYVANIPEVFAQRELIEKVLHTSYLADAGVNEFEHIRERLRDLMKYLPHECRRYDTNFRDEVISTRIGESLPGDNVLETYRSKAESFLKKHQDSGVIGKLKRNIPLSAEDLEELERILWQEIGSKDAYEKEFAQKPLGEFVREIVGLDMAAAKAAFARFLDSNQLDSRQIYFVNQVVEYIVLNGLMKDFSVLQQPPFNNQGSIVDIFTDLSLWADIRKTIEQINANALVA